jgi:hypothetical protein
MRLRQLLLLLLVVAALPRPAVAEEATSASEGEGEAAGSKWQPEAPPHTASTRVGPSFDGLGYLFPIRLHLNRGGYIDGGMGGVDAGGGRLLLLLSRGDLLIDYELVVAVTPLADVDAQAELLATAGPPPLRDGIPQKYRWVPTWRSHLGVLLSFLLPGAGQFIQTQNRGVGFLVMTGVLSSVAVGLLALYGPSSYGPEARRGIAGVFFGLAGGVAIGGAVNAYQSGRERRPVP